MLTADSTTIPKAARRASSEDYARLRAIGITHLQQLGHALWTDFNAHDPGVSLLEALCYALTDLAYKAQLPIEDLLAEVLPDGSEPEQALFGARRILTSHPVTALDYRMLLVDCPGVDNGWLVPSFTSTASARCSRSRRSTVCASVTSKCCATATCPKRRSRASPA
jgi:hypothetical protein